MILLLTYIASAIAFRAFIKYLLIPLDINMGGSSSGWGGFYFAALVPVINTIFLFISILIYLVIIACENKSIWNFPSKLWNWWTYKN